METQYHLSFTILSLLSIPKIGSYFQWLPFGRNCITAKEYVILLWEFTIPITTKNNVTNNN